VKAPRKAREFYLAETTAGYIGGSRTHVSWSVIENPTPAFFQQYRGYIKVREVIDSPEAISDAEGLKK
jgi:hypothetical protein